MKTKKVDYLHILYAMHFVWSCQKPDIRIRLELF